MSDCGQLVTFHRSVTSNIHLTCQITNFHTKSKNTAPSSKVQKGGCCKGGKRSRRASHAAKNTICPPKIVTQSPLPPHLGEGHISLAVISGHSCPRTHTLALKASARLTGRKPLCGEDRVHHRALSTLLRSPSPCHEEASPAWLWGRGQPVNEAMLLLQTCCHLASDLSTEITAAQGREGRGWRCKDRGLWLQQQAWREAL